MGVTRIFLAKPFRHIFYEVKPLNNTFEDVAKSPNTFGYATATFS